VSGVGSAARLKRGRTSPAPARTGLRLLVHEIRAEQLLFWRNREAAIFTFLLPIVFFLMFGSIYGNDVVERRYRGAAFLEAGMIGYGVASIAFAGLAITMVIRRESGVLKRIRATPLPPAAYIGGVLVSTLIVFLIEVAIIVALGRLLFDVPLPRQPLSLALALLLGASCFAALGLAITTIVRSAEGSSAVINIVYLPMAIISGTFFSIHSSPQFLKTVAEVLPLTHFTALTRAIMLDDEPIWRQGGPVGAVVLWGAIGLVVAIRGFRWEPREG
jgi:ABC-2 type transport system permease protein